MRAQIAEKDVRKVESSYKILTVKRNVLIRFPESTEFVRKHSFIDLKGKIVKVAPHCKTVDYYNQQAVIRNFFIYPGLKGQWLVANKVTVLEKFDSYRGKTTIVVDILMDEVKKMEKSDIGYLVPTSKLSIGCPSGKIKIPGSSKYIDFKSV